MNPTQQHLLQRHKQVCRLLNNRKASLAEKRNKLIQSGGSILPALLGPIIAALPWLLQQKSNVGTTRTGSQPAETGANAD